MAMLPNFVAASGCRVMFVFFSAYALAASTIVPNNLPFGVSAPPMGSTIYLVQPGDTLDVKFVKNQKLNKQPTVNPNHPYMPRAHMRKKIQTSRGNPTPR